MKLIIKGKYIVIDEYIEIVSENPLINNFDIQYADYSNTFDIPYDGNIADVIDVSHLRKSTEPYFFIDGYLQFDNELMPVRIMVMNYNSENNKIKLAISEKTTLISGGVNIRRLKLTELRHTVNWSDDEFDEVYYKGRAIVPIGYQEDIVCSDLITYPHAITPNNSCILMDLEKFATFFNQRYNFEIKNIPSGGVFSNRQKPFSGDFLLFILSNDVFEVKKNTKIYINDLPLSAYPAGILEDGKLEDDNELRKIWWWNFKGDQYGNLLTLDVNLLSGIADMEIDIEFQFNGLDLEFVEYLDVNKARYKLPKTFIKYNKFIGQGNRVINFNIENTTNNDIVLELVCWGGFFSEIDNNEWIATEDNSRQLFQNLPDITVLEFLKEIAKATAKYLIIDSNSITFTNIANALDYSQIIDATDYFIESSNVQYSLYDSGQLEYWYKKAETPTLIVPISDERVKNPAKKIEIGILRTDDNNVQLFEDDGKTPLDGIATYPFLDITNKAVDLTNFYLSIQRPFVITAIFREFKFTMNNALLIKQLNGIFIPKKIIRTNKEIIELELLKLEE